MKKQLSSHETLDLRLLASATRTANEAVTLSREVVRELFKDLDRSEKVAAFWRLVDSIASEIEGPLDVELVDESEGGSR